MRLFTCIALLALLITGCKKNRPVARAADYDRFLQPGLVASKVNKLEKELRFWEMRLGADTGSFVCQSEMASYHLKLFKLTGKTAHLHTGDSLLRESSARLRHSGPELLYALSQVSVMQHRFREAAGYIDMAAGRGDTYTTSLLQFDNYMELGKYPEANKLLESLRDKTAFDYLVRRAKWEDHQGRLEAAIGLMEKALEKVKDKNPSLLAWVQSNLGDMYGHAGRVEDAYQCYLSVLDKDPADLYCLKGIAWIAYAHDHNTAEAKRIIQYILSRTSMPDLKLVLADIAETEGRPEEKRRLLESFVSQVTQPAYGDMYNKYLLQIYTNETNEYDKAYALAAREMDHRFTPETCNWMAWVEYKRGNLQQAAAITNAYVINRTSEPDALIHSAYIYAGTGKKEKAKQLLQACLASAFEIGPLQAREVKEKLASL